MREAEEPKVAEDDALTAGSLLRIAGRTVYWFFVVSALLCALFVFVFPYTSMRFYYDSGFRHKTFEMSEKVLSRARPGDLYYGGEAVPDYDTKFADALYWAMNLSAEYMDADVIKFGCADERTHDNARKSFAYANMFLPPIKPLGEKLAPADTLAALRTGRVELMDNALRGAEPRQNHPALSYEKTVRVNRVRAMYVSQNFEWFLEYITATPDDAPLDGAHMDALATWFNELNAAVNLEIDGMQTPLYPVVTWCPVTPYPFLYTGSGFTVGETVYDGDKFMEPLVYLLANLDEIKSYIYTYPADTRASALRRAQWALSLTELLTNLRAVAQTLQTHNPQSEILETLSADLSVSNSFVAGDDKVYASLALWYTAILQDYIIAP